jgi:hypothetical protein
MKYDLGRPPSSKFRGVSFNPNAGRYEARLCIAGRKYNFGLFDDDISAAIVYDAWCEKLGVSCRSNHTLERYATETPNPPALLARICKVCNGATTIRSMDWSNGEWIPGDLIPCPLCQI